jgi:hypothetical protein
MACFVTSKMVFLCKTTFLSHALRTEKTTHTSYLASRVMYLNQLFSSVHVHHPYLKCYYSKLQYHNWEWEHSGYPGGYCRWVLQGTACTVGTVDASGYCIVPVGTAGYCGYCGYCGCIWVILKHLFKIKMIG